MCPSQWRFFGLVYVKYSVRGETTFAKMRMGGHGLDTLWRLVNMLLKMYSSGFCCMYVALSDREFRQFRLPTMDLFMVAEEWWICEHCLVATYLLLPGKNVSWMKTSLNKNSDRCAWFLFINSHHCTQNCLLTIEETHVLQLYHLILYPRMHTRSLGLVACVVRNPLCPWLHLISFGQIIQLQQSMSDVQQFIITTPDKRREMLGACRCHSGMWQRMQVWRALLGKRWWHSSYSWSIRLN